MLPRLATALVIVIGFAPAQAQAPARPPAKPAGFQAEAGSLAQLLNNGWTIQSISGQHGEFLILQLNGRKWVRCELISPSDPRLRYLTGIISDCRGLN